MSELRKKSLVTVKGEVTSEYPFYGDLPMIYMGEIANMKEHGIFIGKSGKKKYKNWGNDNSKFM